MKTKSKKIILFPIILLLAGCSNATPTKEDDKKPEYPSDTVSEYFKIDYYRNTEVPNSAEGVVLVSKKKTIPQNVTKINLKWGDETSTLPDYNELISFDNVNASELEYDFMKNALIPEKATKLYLEAVDKDNVIVDKATLGFEKYKQKNELKYSFQVISDQQIKVGFNAFYRRSKKTFEDIKENSKDSIGIFVNGDVVDEALSENYKSFYESYNSVYSNKETPLYVGIGNHEFIRHNENGNYDGMSETDIQNKFNERLNLWKKETGHENQYFSIEKEDSKFIFLGTTRMPMALGGNTRADCYLGEKQLEWLSNEVSSSANKKIFIMSHGSLRDTVSGSLSKYKQTWYGYSTEEENKIRDIIKNKKNVYFFSSHSHWCFESENPYLITENGPSFFNTAAIGYLWEGTGGGKHYKDGDYENGGAQGLYVEVNDKQIFIKGREFEDVDGTSKYWHTGFQTVLDL